MRKEPARTLAVASGAAGATLRCVGWLKTLGWTFYSRADGLIEYVGTGSRNQSFGLDLGISITSAELWFIASSRLINDTAMNLEIFKRGQELVVTGSASNSATYTVAKEAVGALAEVTVNQLNWSAPHTIYRAGSTGPDQIAWLAAGDRVHITNANGNDGWYHVTAVSGSWADMWFQVAETFTGISSYTTTIRRGHYIAIEETPVEEKPGATVTLAVAVPVGGVKRGLVVGRFVQPTS